MNENGSVTLEAAVALPLFLCFGLALSWFMLTARAEAALRDAVDEAVKMTAAHAYPLELLTQAYRMHPQVQEWESRIQRFIPYSVKVLLENREEDSSGGGARVWSDNRLHIVWTSAFVKQFVDVDAKGKPILDPSKLSVRSVVIPDFATEETSYFGLVVEYKITLPIPFIKPEIVLTAAAMERCWVGEK